MFSCFQLNSLADKDSRFNIGVQLHLMDPVSLGLELKFEEEYLFFY